MLSIPVGIIIRLLPDFWIPENLKNEERKPLITQQRMQWESSVNNVRSELRFFGGIRKAPRGRTPQQNKSHSGRKASTSSSSPASAPKSPFIFAKPAQKQSEPTSANNESDAGFSVEHVEIED